MNKVELLFLYCTHLCARHSEVWLPIKGYPKYEVSSRGRVRSIKAKSKKILKPQCDTLGYGRVLLYLDGIKIKLTYVHRIVARAFWPNPLKKKSVDHIDHNPRNNNITNLRWATIEENNRNRSKQINNTTGVPGVVWCKDKSWRARISFLGHRKHLGYFETLLDAKQARIQAMRRMYKEYANLE
jgi:hypothetical protein